ncbi:ABC transporter substrate-binding protein [Domibacillus enclensis]|uniref:ABC transporter substrate-binding protein n=1 Tax=Domibacillus enclensis TaxID=1017273 RepID=A0ABX4E532_9BACI|nr:nickel ABC transporter substrate-binding protein [Domibacillus enclensis]OXS74674.1 ABC transporter substrate-binding protein [Domibacillus enclensis]
MKRQWRKILVKKRYVKAAILAAAVFLLAACSNSGGESGASAAKEVALLFNFSADSLDPNVESTYVPIRAGITETLVHLNDETLEIEPWLAERWESTDGQNWTIQLREDVTFQNGNKLDGAAVKASLERAMEANPAVQTALKIESIEADGYTLQLKTSMPFAEFPSELVHPNTSIVDVTETDYVNHPVGTGPFQVSAFTPGAEVKLERYDGYWDGAAKLDGAVFRFNEDANARALALQSGEADIVFKPEAESLEMIKSLPGVTVDSEETFRVHQLTMNMASGPLSDVNVRKALDALLERESIVENVLMGLGQPAYGPFPSTFSFAPDYPDKEQGIEAAKAHLQKAGYTEEGGVMQKDGAPLTLKLITYNGRPELPLISQVFQSEAKKIGIEVEIQLVEAPEDYMAANRDWDVSMYSNLTAPRGDAGYYLNATYHPDGALNFSGIEDASLTGMIEALNGTVGQKERSALSKEIAAYIDENMYHSFVVHPNSLVAYNSDKVTDWETTKSEYYMLTNKLDVK